MEKYWTNTNLELFVEQIYQSIIRVYSVSYHLYLAVWQETMLCHHCREELFPKDKESEQSIYTPGLVKYKTTHHCHHLCKNHQSIHDYHVSNCAIEPLSTASHHCFIGTFLYSCWPSSFRTDNPQVSWL